MVNTFLTTLVVVLGAGKKESECDVLAAGGQGSWSRIGQGFSKAMGGGHGMSLEIKVYIAYDTDTDS